MSIGTLSCSEDAAVEDRGTWIVEGFWKEPWSLQGGVYCFGKDVVVASIGCGCEVVMVHVCVRDVN